MVWMTPLSTPYLMFFASHDYFEGAVINVLIWFMIFQKVSGRSLFPSSKDIVFVFPLLVTVSLYE